MNNFLKTASQELESNDILKTASILRRLKNKFLNLFDSKRREEVDKLLNKTQSVKPLLGNTYKKIKEIESSINDLDVESYDRNISELKELVSKLNTEMSTLEGAAEILAEEEVKTESKAKAPAHRVGGAKKGNRDRANIPEGYISKYYEKDGVKLKTLQEVGANLGIDMKFGVNILQTQDFLKPFFAGMARIMFVGNMPLRDPSGPPKAQQYSMSPEEFLTLENKMSQDELKNILYDAMPTFIIREVLGRELNSAGEKKNGTVEIQLMPTESGWVKLPAPMENYAVKIDFYVVDQGDPAKPGNYKLYRQTVQAVKELFVKG